jgi:MGT family glycosyltransferase
VCHTYATHERFAPAVKRLGATHIPTTTAMPEVDDLHHEGIGISPESIGTVTEDVLAGARADLPRIAAYLQVNPVSAVCFDRVIPLSIGPILAARAGVPDIAMWTSLAFTERSNPYGQADHETSKQFDVPAMLQAITDLATENGLAGQEASLMGLLGGSASRLNIVFVAPAFQPDVDSFDDRFRFVGPSLGERGDDESWEPPGGEPLIYVSLGTGFNNRPDIFQACVQAFGDDDRPVAIAIGDHVTRDQLGPIPANIDVRRWFPQLSVLSHAGAFVSHAGMNSVMESLYAGVPLVTLPQMAEQEINARRVEQFGLGVRLDPAAVTPELLRTTVTNLLDDDPTHARLAYLSASARGAVGAAAAADAIEKHLGG